MARWICRPAAGTRPARHQRSAGRSRHALNGSLLREGCVDELLIYQAPMLIGDAARGMFGLAELTDLAGVRNA
jgi:hypothetical protein